MTEQEALDQLTLYAKVSKNADFNYIKECSRCSSKIQKILDRQKKAKPIDITIQSNEHYTYCSICKTKVLLKYKYCYKCGVELDWK